MVNYLYHSPGVTVTVNEHVAGFPEASAKIYMTVVVPSIKESPGALVWLTRSATFDRSVAVIACQKAGPEVSPSSTVIATPLVGQFAIVGGILSAVEGNIVMVHRE